MLGKLLKYEFKATARTFIPVYIAILLISAVNRLFRISNIDIGFNLTVIVLVGLFIALGVLTIIVIIQRFNKNLLSDEGYLMFTLPVSSANLISSKLITALVWTLISAIVAVVAFTILLVDQQVISQFNIFFSELLRAIREEYNKPGMWIAIQLPFISLTSYIGSILVIYLSLATAQLPRFNKHRRIMAFITFFVITIGFQWLSFIIVRIFGSSININDANQALMVFTAGFIGNIIVDVLLFLGIDYILRKHLNLE